MPRAIAGAALGVLLGLTTPAVAAHLEPKDLAGLPVGVPTTTEHYGPSDLQVGDLRVPKGPGPFPVAVIVHGGCWTKGFATSSYMAPIAAALVAKGVATWNIEYRQLGDAGAGWPGSFLDWAAATDHLRDLAKHYPLDLSRVVVVGHSAGATGALWLGARDHLPTTSEIRGRDPLKMSAVVAIDGPGDVAAFIGADAEVCGKPVIAPFMGGTPAASPDHYRQGNPIEMLPSGAPTVLVASEVLQPEAAEAYRIAATAKGDALEVLSLQKAGHFDMLSPTTSSGAVVVDLVLHALDLSK